MNDRTEIRDVSETAVWVAYYRGLETDRPDALFRDPLARLLTAERGEQDRPVVCGLPASHGVDGRDAHRAHR